MEVLSIKLNFFQIFIPYCSSDAHMADTKQEIGGRTVYFRGRRLAFETGFESSICYDHNKCNSQYNYYKNDVCFAFHLDSAKPSGKLSHLTPSLGSTFLVWTKRYFF